MYCVSTIGCVYGNNVSWISNPSIGNSFCVWRSRLASWSVVHPTTYPLQLDAGVADPANVIAVDAAYRADAIHRDSLSQLITFTTDIPSVYLQNDLTRQDTAGRQA